jgi:phosphotransferase system HPr-like phosphotransfer protein
LFFAVKVAVDFRFEIVIAVGINPHLATQLKNLSQKFSCNITVSKGNNECSGKDIYGLIMLKTRVNETITVKAIV